MLRAEAFTTKTTVVPDGERRPTAEQLLARYTGSRRHLIAGFLIALLAVGVLNVAMPALLTGTAVPPALPFQTAMLLIPIALAGLLLRRRGLYLTAVLSTATVWAAVFAGVDWQGLDLFPTTTRWIVALDFTIAYLAIAVLLDRFGIALRTSLLEAARNESRLLAEALEAKAELEAQRELNQKIRENFPGVYFLLDEDGRYVQWNRNVTDVLGIDDEEMSNTTAYDLIAPGDREAVKATIAHAMEGERASVHARALAKGGKRVPFYFTGTSVNFRGRRLLAGVGIDRRELDIAKQHIVGLNEVLTERVRTLSALHAIDAAIAGTRDTGRTLGVILEQALGRLRMDAGNLLLYSQEKERLVFGAAKGFRDSEWRPVSVPVGHGMVGRCAERRQIVRLLGTDTIARHVWRHAQYRLEGFETYVAVPLIANGELMGVMELFTRSRQPGDPRSEEFLHTVGAQAAIAIDNSNLIAGLERSNHELRQSYDLTIEGWAKALDLKDQETEGHSRRVTELTVALAGRLGMTGEKLMHVRRGALLHDIGKMGVPDAILLKPGKLDAHEWDVMKRHTTHAYELLRPIPFLWPALDIPHLHHEKWDGTGYPLGLRGDEIPVAARIFAVVDVYDALTSDRPYRRAWSCEDALAYIAQQAGSHFDPAVAAEFLRMMGADRSGRIPQTEHLSSHIVLRAAPAVSAPSSPA